MARWHVWLWLGVLVCLGAAIAGATLTDDILLPVAVDVAGLDDGNSPLDTRTYSPCPDWIGRFIAFARYQLTAEGIDIYDVWVRDRGTGRSYLISNDGVEFGYITADGYHTDPVISAAGDLVAFVSSGYGPWPPGHGFTNIFVAPVPATYVSRVSVNNSGAVALGDCYDPEMTPEGRYIVYTSDATNLVVGDNNGASDIFVRDRVQGVTELISVNTARVIGNGASFSPGISDDGRYVVFASEATNLGPGDTNNVADIFVRDRVAGATTRITFSNWGEQADDGSMTPCISGDGRIIAYSSLASNLVAGDHDWYYDIYVYDRGVATTERASATDMGGESYGDCFDPNLDYTGTLVLFESNAFDLDPTWSSGGVFTLFIRNRVAGTTRALLRAYDDNGAPVIPDGNSWGPRINRLGNYVTFTTLAENISEAAGANVYTRWDGRTFADVPTFYWAYDPIDDFYWWDIVQGYDDPDLGLVFRPLEPTTRAAMAVVIARILCGGDANVPFYPPPGHFTDVPYDHWAYDYIEYVYEHDIIRGYEDGTFDPDGEVDRAEMCVFIARAMCGGDAGVPDPVGGPGFSDMLPTDPDYGYAYKYVEYCRLKNVVRGFDDGTFRPDLVITRDQACVFAHRAFYE